MFMSASDSHYKYLTVIISGYNKDVTVSCRRES